MKRTVLFILGLALLSGCHEHRTLVNLTPINLPAEIERARTEHKLLLLEFGSSDSCPPCTRFERHVFSTPEFGAYAASNLVFVRLDFPFKTDPPPDVQATNVLLAKRFDIPAFPTFIALDATGTEFWRMPSKDDAAPVIDDRLYEPKAFMEMIDSVKQKRP